MGTCPRWRHGGAGRAARTARRTRREGLEGAPPHSARRARARASRSGRRSRLHGSPLPARSPGSRAPRSAVRVASRSVIAVRPLGVFGSIFLVSPDSTQYTERRADARIATHTHAALTRAAHARSQHHVTREETRSRDAATHGHDTRRQGGPTPDGRATHPDRGGQAKATPFQGGPRSMQIRPLAAPLDVSVSVLSVRPASFPRAAEKPRATTASEDAPSPTAASSTRPAPPCSALGEAWRDTGRRIS
jgi:hypothetical protein